MTTAANHGEGCIDPFQTRYGMLKSSDMLWLLKLTSPLVLVIREGKVSLEKGRLPGSATKEIQDILTEAAVATGTIHADGSGRFHFSREIPRDLHQKLRNILVSP